MRNMFLWAQVAVSLWLPLRKVPAYQSGVAPANYEIATLAKNLSQTLVDLHTNRPV